MRSGKLLLAAAIVSGWTVFVHNASVSANSTGLGQPRALSSALPEVVRSGEARPVGPKNADSKLNVTIVLRLRNPGLAQRVDGEIGTPGSPLFGHPLTQAQANRLFNPTSNQQGSVVSWLRSNGVTVSHTATNHLVVSTSGPVSAYEHAFGTAIDRFRATTSGGTRVFYAPVSVPILPAAVSRTVSGVVGLDSYTRFVTEHTSETYLGKASQAIRRDGEIDGDSNWYYPTDFREEYDAGSLDGGGFHLGIVMWCDPPSDAALKQWGGAVSSQYPQQSAGTLIVHQVASLGSGDNSDQPESDLDTEYSFGLASGARIDYWQTIVASGDACSGGDPYGDGATLITAENDAGTTSGSSQDYFISNSWDACGDGLTSYLDPIFESDISTGHNFFFSSGDSGSDCNGVTVAGYPAASPYVTAVGGTAYGGAADTLGPASITSNYQTAEVAWNYNPAPEGSGGGYADNEARIPGYQPILGTYDKTAGSCSSAGSAGCRGVPDIAGPADPIYAAATIEDSNGNLYGVGGTSEASPVMAGLFTDVANQYWASTGSTLGFVNPALYAFASNSTIYSSVFHDVTVGTNGDYNASTNWDPVTGLGSIDALQLESHLEKVSSTRVDSSSSNNTSTYGDQVSFTASISAPYAAAGTVTFYDGQKTLGTVGVANNSAVFTTTLLTTGQHSITATFTPSSKSSLYGSTSAALNQTVTQASLTVTAGSPTITYGQSTPTINPQYAGLKNGAKAPATPATCSTVAPVSGAKTGTYSTSCTGAQDNNYVISYVTGSLTVKPATLTVTASSPSTTYGHSFSVTAIYSGLENGDSAPATTPTCGLTTPISGKVNAGTYATSCNGAADPNYSVTYVSGSLTVSPANLSITAGSPSIAYGQSTPTITAGYSGLENGDKAPAKAPSCGSTAPNSGKVVVGQYTTSCSGAQDANYAISYVAGKLTVTPASLTITAGSPSIVYGHTTPSITPQYSGLMNGDTAPATGPTCRSLAPASGLAPIGSYTTSCSGAVDSNYTIAYDSGSLTVTPKQLVVAASPGTMTYGGSAPKIGFTYSGFAGADTSSVVSGAPTCSTAVTSSSAVGNYASTCDISHLSAANYTFAEKDGVVKVKPAVITVTASSPSIAFGQMPHISFSYSGFVNHQTTTVISGKPACTTKATKSSAPGAYQTTCETTALKAFNYTFSGKSGKLEITKAAIKAAFESSKTAVIGKPYAMKETLSNAAAGSAVSGVRVTLILDPGHTQQTCAATADSHGIASCSLKKVTVAAGKHPVEVSFPGNVDYNALSSEVSVTVKK